MRIRHFLAVGAALLGSSCIASGLLAEPTALPYTFAPGAKARADEVNANFNALAGKLPKNVIVVSPNPAGQLASGMDLLSALAAIDNVGVPSELRLTPGTYNLGSGSLVAKADVNITGSGIGSTIITSSNTNVNEGTIQAGVNGVQISQLSVYNTSTGANGVALTMIGGAAHLKDMAATVTGPMNGYGIRALYSPYMKNVTVNVTAIGQAIALDVDSVGSASIWDSGFSAIGGFTSIGIRAQNASDLVLIRDYITANNAATVNHGIELNGNSTAQVSDSFVDIINTATANAAISLATTGSTTWFGMRINNTAASASNGVEVSGGQHVFVQSYIMSNTNAVVRTGGSVELVMTYFTQPNSGSVTCSGVGPTGARFSAGC